MTAAVIQVALLLSLIVGACVSRHGSDGASTEWTLTELGGLAGYGLVARIGATRFAPLVGVGWLPHVLWHVALHPGGGPKK